MLDLIIRLLSDVMFQTERFHEANVYLGSQGSVSHKDPPSPALISPPSKDNEEDDMDNSGVLQNYGDSMLTEISFPFPPSQPKQSAVDSDSISPDSTTNDGFGDISDSFSISEPRMVTCLIPL